MGDIYENINANLQLEVRNDVLTNKRSLNVIHVLIFLAEKQCEDNRPKIFFPEIV